MYEVGPIKRTFKRSRHLTIAVRIVRDRLSGIAMMRGPITKTMGATHRTLDIDASLRYIDTAFTDYLTYGDMREEELVGMRVLELGPGDSLGVAIRFLAAGVDRVDGVDRFVTWRDPAQQVAITDALTARLGKIGLERLDLTEGMPIEEAAVAFPAGSFDLVISRAVMEHVYDSDAALEAIDRLLCPGGRSLHKIDFEDHGLFTAGGLHPLTFLTIPERTYRLMGQNSGLPNRRLIDYYRSRMSSYGYESRIFTTHLVGRSDELQPHPETVSDEAMSDSLKLVAGIRPRLQPQFQNLSDRDLAVSGIFLASLKPETGA